MQFDIFTGKAFVSPLLRVEVSSEVADGAVGPFGRGISVAHDSLSIAYTVIASMLIIKIVRHAKVVTHFMCCDLFCYRLDDQNDAQRL